MSAQADKGILLRSYQCKIRAKINIQQFLDIVGSEPRLEKLSEKGLFILYLCEMLLKAFVAQGLKIQNFISEFDKKDVDKRQRRERGQGAPRRKRQKKNENTRGGKTLEELTEESLSNPSNVERPRINVNEREKELSGNVPPSKEKGQDSNGSKDSKDSKDSKNILKMELNKITEEIRGHEETFVDNMDFVPAGNIEQNSQTSSSHDSGEISNLSEKIKIFTNIKEREPRTTATRRKAGQSGHLSRGTRTKKKVFEIVDQSTLLEETTRVSQNDATVNYTEISMFDGHEIQQHNLANNFMKRMELGFKQLPLQLFQKDKIDNIRSLIQAERKPDDESYRYDNVLPMEEQTDNIQFPDYTMSQPTSAPLFEPDFFKESLELKDSEFNFYDLMSHSSKEKSTMFYQLLWREQNDEIVLMQSNPEQFSEIKIRQK